jgi:hypothetical protein
MMSLFPSWSSRFPQHAKIKVIIPWLLATWTIPLLTVWLWWWLYHTHHGATMIARDSADYWCFMMSCALWADTDAIIMVASCPHDTTLTIQLPPLNDGWWIRSKWLVLIHDVQNCSAHDRIYYVRSVDVSYYMTREIHHTCWTPQKIRCWPAWSELLRSLLRNDGRPTCGHFFDPEEFQPSSSCWVTRWRLFHVAWSNRSNHRHAHMFKAFATMMTKMMIMMMSF